MKTITLHNTNLSVPEIGMGCMRINSLETADAVKEWINTALAHDINFFDHAARFLQDFPYLAGFFGCEGKSILLDFKPLNLVQSADNFLIS